MGTVNTKKNDLTKKLRENLPCIIRWEQNKYWDLALTTESNYVVLLKAPVIHATNKNEAFKEIEKILKHKPKMKSRVYIVRIHRIYPLTKKQKSTIIAHLI